MSPRLRQLATVALPPLLVACLFVVIWYAIREFVLAENQKFLLPPITDVIDKGFLNSRNLNEILGGLWLTIRVVVIGFSISLAIGFTLAVLMSQAGWIERTIFPYAVALQALPILAVVPLIGLLLEFSFRAQLVVVVIISIFPLITNTLFGLKSAEASQHDLFTLHGASRMTRLKKLMLPAALPALFTGMRISAGLAVIGAIVGEFFFRSSTERGLGRLISVYSDRAQLELLITSVIFSSGLGVALFVFFGWLAKRATHWHPSHADS